MSRAIVTIRSKADREKLKRWADGVPDLTRVVWMGPKRSIPQNDLLWACLTDISRQATYHGLQLPPEDWKDLFMNALNKESRMVPNLDGTGYIALGRSTSQLSHAEFSDLIEIIRAWGAANQIKFSGEEIGG